jgi:fructokinase
LAFASLDEQGRASYDFYVSGTADWGWTAAELGDLPAGMQVFHTGSLAAAVLPGADVVLERVEQLHAQGDILLSFDPNVRPALAGEHGRAVHRTERFVSAAHVVKASDEDVAWLYPDQDLVEVARRWSTMGPSFVVVTRGGEGCLAVTAAGSVLERPAREIEVVDTIGAGDAFESGLLSGLADAGAKSGDDVSALTDAELRAVLDRAVLVSAMTCQRAGADPPVRAEYEAQVARN